MRWLTLKPYGSNLLVIDGGIWIFSVRILMLFLISTECTSWGYAAWHIVDRAYAPYLAFIVILVTFAMNWTLDASIMSLDRNRMFVLNSPEEERKQARSMRYKIFSLVAFRGAMIAALLYASSGFLVQALFSKDIESELANQNRALISKAKLDALSPLKASETELKAQIANKELEVTREVQGLSPDGQPGCRSACEILKEQLKAARKEMAETEDSITAVEHDFQFSSPAELKDKYQIKLLGDGIQARGRIVDDFKKSDGFKRAELAIQAALLMLFLGLLVLKVCQPPSVALYFCSALQDLYDRYLEGVFDHLLLPHQLPHARSGGMSPYEFAVWAGGYLKVAECERLRQVEPLIDANQSSRRRVFKEHAQEIESELDAMKKAQSVRDEQVGRIEAKLKTIQFEISAATEQIQDWQNEVENLQNALLNLGVPENAYEPVLNRIGKLGQLLRSSGEALNVKQIEQELLESDLARLRFELGEIATRIGSGKSFRNFLNEERALLHRDHIFQLKELWTRQDRITHSRLEAPGTSTIESEESAPEKRESKKVSFRM